MTHSRMDLLDPNESDRKQVGVAFERLWALMNRLRAQDGCPWDRAQDLLSLRPYLIEEAYEVLDALERGSLTDHQEELGDLLLQVIFQAAIRREEEAFDLADVAHGISDKLVRRHPHVFGTEEKRADPSHAYERWEEMKSKEKKEKRSIFAGVPPTLPALLRAQRLGEKASSVGFDWENIDGPVAKMDEELSELKAAIEGGERQRIEEELGDLLFSLVNLARFTRVSAEDALRGTAERFIERFRHVEDRVKEQGKTLREASLEEMDSFWEEAKRMEEERVSENGP